MNTKLKVLALLSALLCTFLLSMAVVSAAPYSGELFELRQPDGSYVRVRIFGDEFYQRVESLDGYTLIRDPKTDWICYADLNEYGTDFTSTGVAYKDTSESNKIKALEIQSKLPKGLKISNQSVVSKVLKAQKDIDWDKFLKDASSAAEEKVYSSSGNSQSSSENDSISAQDVTGNVVGLTLLIDFPDQKSNISKNEISNMLNQTGYTGYSNNGSVKDYFQHFSGGELVYTNIVTDYYTAKYNKYYYDNPDQGRAGELIWEALQNLKDKGFDFSALTVDSTNTVIALNVFYAGQPDWGWSKGLWPHAGSIQTFTANGVNFRRYQITDIGNELSIGTFVHENGHLVGGWPDTYDYGGESSGAGGFDVMASSHAKNPLPPNPYFANILAGWGNTLDLNSYADGSSIQAPQNSLDPFVFKRLEADEYFIAQSIKREGRYTNMPGEGLLIWHIDETGSNNLQNMAPSTHYKVSVEQADGLFELEKGLGSNPADLFYAGNKNSFGPATIPNSNWWNSHLPSISLTEINADGTQFTFNRALPIDITEQGTITVSNATSPQNEGKENAFDNNLKTKWLISDSSGYVQYDFNNDEAYTVTSYSISSANDFPESDPASWTLYGSNDSETWETLDNKISQDFSSRFETRVYSIYNSNAYKYYRLELSNDSQDALHLSDIQLFGYKYSPTPQITASGDNASNGEGKDNAFDNNANTKWLVFNNSAWITYDFGKPITVSSYSITSANDNLARDPASWRLWASKDNINWALLDSQNKQYFGNRLQTNLYATDGNTDSFLYYKLELQSNSSILHLSEIQFFEVTAGSENQPNEGKEKAFDGDTSTKWLSFNSSDWITFRYFHPTAIGSYAIASANDYPDRDPRSWTLMASNDNENWVVLDERSNELFDNRFEKKNYSFSNSTQYSYYRLNITQNNGSSLLQLSEIEYILSTSTPTPTPTATPTPTPTPSGNIEVEFYNGNTAGSTNGISMNFRVTNSGSSPINLSDVKLRYYYTIDGEKAQNFFCDWWTYNDPSKITGQFVKLEEAGTNADYYLEIGFASDAGTLPPGSSIEIRSRISKSDWTFYNQTNDYSFNASNSYYAPWDKTTAYLSGIKVWGIEP